MNDESMNGGGSRCIKVDGPQGAECRPIGHVQVDARMLAILPCLIAEDFEPSLQRLADKAQMVHRDDGTTGFTFG